LSLQYLLRTPDLSAATRLIIQLPVSAIVIYQWLDVSLSDHHAYGTMVNNPEDLSILKESISYLNASDRNLVDNSFSVESFFNK